MSLIDFTNKVEKEEQSKIKDKEIYKYIVDERILRVLFEGGIFQLRDIQKEAIRKGLFFRRSF